MESVLIDGLFSLPVARRTAVVAGASAVAALAGIAPRRRLYVLGDSWAAGLHADPAHALGQVAAARLGWSVQVNAVSGTGYLNRAGSEGSYPERASDIAAGGSADVVLLQGGSNDDAQIHADIPDAARETVRIMQSRFRGARVVMLGPGPDPEPVTDLQQDVDRVLQVAAAGLRVPYVSMLQEDWIPAASADRVIDPATDHPTTAGQRYLGARIAASIKRICPELVR